MRALQRAPRRMIAADTSGACRRATPIDTLGVPEKLDLRDKALGQEQPAKRQRQTTATAVPEPITTMTSAPRSVCTSSASMPYIGVGLEVYCAVEPCLMCAMALVHSRISRVVYRLPLQVRRD